MKRRQCNKREWWRRERTLVWVWKLHTTQLTAVKLPTVQSAWELSSRSHPMEFHSCTSTIQNHTKINEIHTADGGSGRDIHLPKHLCFLCTSCCSHTQRVVVRRDILKYSCASWGTYRGGQAFWCSSCYCYYTATIIINIITPIWCRANKFFSIGKFSHFKRWQLYWSKHCNTQILRPIIWLSQSGYTWILWSFYICMFLYQECI